MAGNVHEHQRQRQRSVNTLALGATVHCLSGCAIGRFPIRRAWFAVVFPALVLN